jgi:hypothetical protein
MRGIATLGALIVLLLLAAPAAAQSPSPGGDAWTPVILTYTGDIGGKIEPCG